VTCWCKYEVSRSKSSEQRFSLLLKIITMCFFLAKPCCSDWNVHGYYLATCAFRGWVMTFWFKHVVQPSAEQRYLAMIIVKIKNIFVRFSRAVLYLLECMSTLLLAHVHFSGMGRDFMVQAQVNIRDTVLVRISVAPGAGGCLSRSQGHEWRQTEACTLAGPQPIETS
jgi:hypothetical protein